MGSVVYLRKEPQRSSARAPDSLLRPGVNCHAVARAERAALLVDAADYFKVFYQAALKAKRSMVILAWDFNSQTRLHFDEQAKGAPPALLGDFLNWLTHRRRGACTFATTIRIRSPARITRRSW